ncbi:hypothetical protein GDO81_007658 [Engystomops pustulosus]|uniref:Cystatin domain-containing protein n=1 Tax=Engystomops pustulosus TaxID=76066 RepID=A0AAV7CAQ6_ENGPU|nr:hypothetical protein GDO81_007658 [Engystomops pustulosus]KAG8581403.1 hypothetical protein GDO81_007658 [Engystomops pustulosus]
MERILVVALLVTLCTATSPPFPNIIPLDCNATQIQTDLAVDLINKERNEGFVLRPVRVESVFQQESVKLRGAFIYYLDLDVIETECPVVSGKSWKDCSIDIPFHEMVFGHCKATIFISRPWRILKLVNYNCTLGTVPARAVHMICPDCPALVRDISPKIQEKADRLIEQFNKESNQTHHFKVDNIARVRTQYVFGQSYFFQFTIKETECLKTQTEVNLANCNYLKEHEAHIGFCKGSTFTNIDKTEGLHVTCEIYNPRDDQDDHHGHGHCHHGSDYAKTEQGQEKPNVDEAEVQQGGSADAPGKCGHHKHRHGPHHRGHRHHHHGHDHHHPHHHHHHHHDHLNDSHPHDPSHHHHHHHHHHNHTSSKDGSSSEEHSDPKPFQKRSKGSVQMHELSDEETVPVPTIVRLPPPQHPGKHGKDGKHDNIEFPSEHSNLKTCPGEPLVDLPEVVKKRIF